MIAVGAALTTGTVLPGPVAALVVVADAATTRTGIAAAPVTTGTTNERSRLTTASFLVG
jgi:hypothetical protein